MIVIHVRDPRACGMGEGERCCAFLTVAGAEGFTCGRTMPEVAAAIAARLLLGTMNAQYDPGDKAFPQCQEERPRAA